MSKTQVPGKVRSDYDDPVGLKPEGLIPLDEAIARFGENEVVGGDGMTLGQVKEYFPGLTVYVEEQYFEDGKPYFETLWTDVSAIRGDEDDGKWPHIPTGDETWFVREDGREYIIAWYD